jgi:hypothetical protein
MLDAMPHPVMVVDDDVRIVDGNTAALAMVKDGPQMLNRRGGEALRCINAFEHPGGCGHAQACRTCVIRNSVNRAVQGDKVSRRAQRLEIREDGGRTKSLYLLITTAPVEISGNRLALLVLEDISEIIELRGIVPICAGCRKIRNDDQFWVNVESYFRTKLDLNFSHGLCPDCMKRLYPDEAI